MASQKKTTRKTNTSYIQAIDNTGAFQEEAVDAIKEALYICGEKAVGYARKILTANGSVVTGLLRNSITYACSGEATAIQDYSAQTGGKSGSYQGKAPEAGERVVKLYLGTNVEYAPHVELGTDHSRAKPYIAPAISNYGSEYKSTIEKYLKKHKVKL